MANPCEQAPARAGADDRSKFLPCVTLVLVANLWACVATAQIAVPPAPVTESSTNIEEVIVRGRARARLQQQIELATEALFSRFNEINSDDEFDIHCRDVQVTGSKIPRRICRPDFWRTAEARGARQTVNRLQGSYSMDPTSFLHAAYVQHDEMSLEMKRLLIEDDAFREAAARVGELQRLMDDESGSARPSKASTARIAVAADSALPYDAQLMADVRIGRNSWVHALTHHTFAIAFLYGGIDSIAVRCEGERARFEHEVGAEWTLPADWERCKLTVNAARGTSFTLFEFE